MSANAPYPEAGSKEDTSHAPHETGTGGSLGSSGKPAGNSDNVRWIVLGTCVIVGMLLFRQPISNVLNHTDTLTVTKTGFTIKTVKTPLGDAQVTAVSVEADTVAQTDGIQGSTYTSHKYGFEISWPADGSWNASDTAGAMYLDNLRRNSGQPLDFNGVEVPLILARNAPGNGVLPNVNVTVQPVSSIGIPLDSPDAMRLELNATARRMQESGWTVLSSTVDESTRGGFLVMINNRSGYPMYQFQKYVVANNRVYCVTATQIPPEDELSQQLRDALRGILDSFHPII